MTYIPRQINAKTAFGELEVAEMSPIFQGSFEYTVDNTELNENTETSSGTVTQSTAMAVVASGTTANSDAQLKSRTHAKYRPGQGGNCRFTALFSAAAATCYQYIGLADERGSTAAFKNGYMIGYDGTTFGFHRFANDVKTTVTQANWDDPLDGTGKSGMTLDNTKINVWQITFQYLGAGAIILSVEDDSTGNFVEVHRVLYANNNTAPSVYMPNFHFIIDVDNGATTNNVSIKSASYAYFIEGKNSFLELHQPIQSTGIRTKSISTTETAIFTIKNRDTYNSITNYIDIVLQGVSLASFITGGADRRTQFRLIKNTTLGGTPSYTDINTSDSIVEIDVAGTTVSGGKDVASFTVIGSGSITGDLNDYKIVLEPGDTLTVAGVVDTGTYDLTASILWKELF